MKKKFLQFNKLIGLLISLIFVFSLNVDSFAQKADFDKTPLNKKVEQEKTIEKTKTRTKVVNNSQLNSIPVSTEKLDKGQIIDVPNKKGEKGEEVDFSAVRTSKTKNLSKDLLLFEDFCTWPADGWTQITVGAGWVDGSCAAFHNDNSGTQDDWIISPALTIPASGAYYLMFTQFENYSAWAVYHGVWVGPNADMTGATEIYNIIPADGEDNVFLDLSAFAGQTVYIGWNYQGNYSDEWWVYDVIVDNAIMTDFVFEAANNPALSEDVTAEVNMDAHEVVTTLQYGTDLTALMPTVSYIPGVMVTPTTFFDAPMDFSSDVPFELTGTAPADANWIAKMDLILYTEAELTDFSVNNPAVDNFGVEKGMYWDEYGNDIELQILFDSLLTEVIPTFTTTPYATIYYTDDTTYNAVYDTLIDYKADFTLYNLEDTIDFTNPVLVKIVSQDLANENFYHIKVINQDSLTGNDILSIEFVEEVVAADIDYDNKHIVCIVADSIDLDTVHLDTITYSLYSVLDTVGTIDWSELVELPVISQSSDTVIWTVDVRNLDDELPVVTAAAQSVTNYGDSVLVATNEVPGKVYIILDGQAGGDFDAAVAALMGAVAEVDASKEEAYLFTDFLVPGDYYAYAVDSAGNVSDTTDANPNVIVIDTAEVEVATLAEMDHSTVLYNYTGEALVTYHQLENNMKWIQDESRGIEIYDTEGIIPDTVTGGAVNWEIGDAVTGIKGHYNNNGGLIQFIPEVAGTVSSSDNEIVPVELSLEDFIADNDEYQSQLVVVNNIFFTDSKTDFAAGTDYGIENYVQSVFRTAFDSADYIGEVIPDSAVNVIGIKSYSVAKGTIFLTARSSDDFAGTVESEFYYDTDEIDFGAPLIGDNTSGSVQLRNIGAGTIVVNSAYIEGDNSFSLDEGVYNQNLVAGTPFNINLTFTPATLGDKEATLTIVYNGSDTVFVYLIGTGATAPVFDIPYFQGWETDTEGWTQVINEGDGFFWTAYGDFGSSYEMTHFGYNFPDLGPVTDAYLISPAIDLIDATAPILSFSHYHWNAGYATTQVLISTDKENWDIIVDFTGNIPTTTILDEVFSLADWTGSVVYIAFYINEPDWGYGSPVEGWELDDISIEEFPTTPYFTLTPNPIDFGDVEIGESNTLDIGIDNTGISYFLVQDMTIDDPNYEILESSDKAISDLYPVKVRNGVFPFQIIYTPDETAGEHTATLSVMWTDPILGDSISEIPITAESYHIDYEAELVSLDVEKRAIDNEGNIIEEWWDDYSQEIEFQILPDANVNAITTEIEISKYATVKYNGTTIENGSAVIDYTDPVTFTITSKDNLVINEWLVTVTNQDSLTGNDIVDVVIAELVEAADIDAVEKIAVAIVAAGTDLAAITVDIEVSPYATIDMTATPDWTDTVEVTVISQLSDTAEWIIVVLVDDVVAPVVTAAVQTVTNYEDSATVSSSEEGGELYIILDGEEGDLVNIDSIFDAAIENLKGASIELEAGETDGKIPTDFLEEGTYYAFAADLAGNVSDKGTNAITVVKDTVEVATIAELWDGYETVIYNYTGDAVVTYVQDYRNKKWIQDATAGIEIDDDDAVIAADAYVIGDVITGLLGTLNDYFDQLQFVPLAEATVVDTMDVIEPIEVTLEDFNEDLYVYQSQLVVIRNVVFADAGDIFATGDKYDIANYTDGIFRTSFYDANYIDSVIPEGPIDIIGIKSVNYGDPVITARSEDDFSVVNEPIFYVDAEEVDFDGVLLGENNEMTVQFGNIGAGEILVNNVAIDGDNDFSIANPLFNEVFENNEFYEVNIIFTPNSIGDKEAELQIITGEDTTFVALFGSGIIEPVFTAPYHNDFLTEVDGWSQEIIEGAGFIWDDVDGEFYHIGYLNPDQPVPNDIMLISPAIELGDLIAPVVAFTHMQFNIYWATTELWVSTDKENWDAVENINLDETAVYTTTTVSLADYVGETVYVGLNYYEPDYDYGSPIMWWHISDFNIEDAPTTPIFAVDPDSYEFGPVEVADTADIDISVINIGIGNFVVDTIYLTTTDTSFTITNEVVYPINIRDNEVTVNVAVIPDTAGIHEAMLVIEWTDATLGDSVVEVPISALGYAISCADAIEVFEGDNVAEFAPSWFTYTATQDGVLHITSCWEDQRIDTDLEVYDACGGNLVAANDDIDAPAYDGTHLCENGYNYASDVVFPVANGVEYKLNWIDTWSSSGFVFVIEIYDAPASPEIVSVTPHEVFAEIQIIWEGIPVAVGLPIPTYNLYKNGSMIVEGTEATAYLDSDVELETEYCYKVIQIMPDESLSQFSSNICATTADMLDEGMICENPIPLTLPVVDYAGTTEGFGDFYADPGVCDDHYLNGNDVVFTFTVEQDGYISGSIEGEYLGMHVIDNCPSSPDVSEENANVVNCIAFASDGTTSNPFANRPISAGTYYVIVATWPPPQETTFTMNLSYTTRVYDITIADIQGETEVSPYEGQFVTTSGIVTTSYSSGYFLQDGEGEWNGVMVYDTERGAVVGDDVTIAGTVLEYYGVTEIADVTDYTIVSSGNDLPAAAVITVADIGESYEGVLVEVPNVICYAKDLDHGDFATAQGADLLLVNNKIYTYDANIGTSYDITGVINYSWDEFKILPREADDVKFRDGINHIDLDAKFGVYPNPNNGLFTLEIINEKSQDIVIELVNAQGEILYRNEVKDVNSLKDEIDVKGIAAGIYYLRVFNGDEFKYQKVVIQ
ncbi:MAG: choice-of-anchor D domain-containing protein [Bacteroidales bacterium]|nr:choice-of-anchor D domain-containing protein [Bacteroidales bacterium]